MSTPRSLTPAIRAFGEGEPVLLAGADGAGALVAVAGARVTGPALTTVAELGGDLVMLAVGPQHAGRLGLLELPRTTRERDGIVPTMSIDAAARLGDAGSPDGRAHTIRVASDPACTSEALSSPGHVHTAIAAGDTDAAAGLSLELALLAGCPAAVVLSSVVDARGDRLTLAEAAELPGPAGLIAAPAAALRSCAIVRQLEHSAVRCSLPTRIGSFRAVALVGPSGGETALALVHGEPQLDPSNVIVHTHIACMLGDTFGSTLCGCRPRLEQAAHEIVAAGTGVIVYVRPSSSNPFGCPAGRQPDRTLTRRALAAAGVRADQMAA